MAVNAKEAFPVIEKRIDSLNKKIINKIETIFFV